MPERQITPRARRPAVDRDRHMRRGGDEYTHAFLSLLPQGQAWPKAWDCGSDSLLYRVHRGLAWYWGFVDGRAADLLERESDPRQTVELLPDWERAWGLPDPCFPEATTIAERQKMLVLYMTYLGGQSREYYYKLLEWLGIKIFIKEFAPFMAGISRVGDTRERARVRYEFDPDTGGWRPISLEGTTVSVEGVGIFISGSFDTLAELEAAHPTGDFNEGFLIRRYLVSVSGTLDAVEDPDGTTMDDIIQNWNGPVVTPTAPPPFAVHLYVWEWQGATGQWVDVGDVREVITDATRPNPGEPDDNFRWYVGPPEMRFAWSANVGHPQLTWFRCASGQCGVDPHLSIGVPEDTQCLLNRWKPAHTALVMSLDHMAFSDPMQGTP